MLHWHPWWMHTTDGSSRTPTNPLAPNETAWSPEQWLEAQARFWDRCLESNRAWWKMAADSLPSVSWPRAGVLEPPQPPGGDEAPAEPAEPHKTPYAVKRRRPVASGAARAKLARQRKR